MREQRVGADVRVPLTDPPRVLRVDRPSSSIPTRTEFHDLPLALLRSALAILVKQGKAQVFKVPSGDDGEEGEGVKFA